MDKTKSITFAHDSLPNDIKDKVKADIEADKEIKRQEALKRVNDTYYDSKSPHYRDNIWFTWAVNTINERFENNDY